MLKKDPLSLFAPALPVRALLKRDAPELHDSAMPDLELAKRQLPTLSSGLSGVGVGGLPLSGIQGQSFPFSLKHLALVLTHKKPSQASPQT